MNLKCFINKYPFGHYFGEQIFYFMCFLTNRLIIYYFINKVLINNINFINQKKSNIFSSPTSSLAYFFYKGSHKSWTIWYHNKKHTIYRLNAKNLSMANIKFKFKIQFFLFNVFYKIYDQNLIFGLIFIPARTYTTNTIKHI